MRKKYLALPSLFFALVLLATGLSAAYTKQLAQAQTPVTPTLYCLSAACPGQNISGTVTPSIGVSPSISLIPTIAVSPTISVPAASGNQPCSNGTSTVSPENGAPDQGTDRRGSHRGKGGFLKDIFQLLIMFLELILKVTGGSLPCQIATPTPSPAPSIAPSSAPSVAPVSTAPATSPAVSAAPPAKTAQTPNQLFDLTKWYLSVPVGSAPTNIQTQQLAGGYTDNYFKMNSTNDGVVFRAPVNGPTTSGSSYPRSELREMTDNGATKAAWESSSGTHTMTIEQAITAVPQKKPHVVAGQIHDASDDVIVVRLEMPKLLIKVGDKTIGATLDENYELGKKFTVKFEVTGGKTSIYYNNATTPAYTMDQSYSGAYFKAGAYTQSNCSTDSDCSENNFGEVVIYRLEVTHQ